MPTTNGSPSATNISTNNPNIKSVLNTLFEIWPRALPFNELLPEEDRDMLTATVMQCYLANLVQLIQHPPKFVLEPSQRPRAFPMARLQAADGLDRVSTLRHRTIILGDFDRMILAMLDGRHTREQLVEEALASVARGDFAIQKKDEAVTDMAEARQVIADSLPIVLQRLATAALLVE